MSMKTKTCDVCGKETTDFYCIAGLEVDKDCFETLVRISKYNYKDWNDKEKECASKFLRAVVEDMTANNEESEVDEDE